jgi:leucyl-tRNA synthetase
MTAHHISIGRTSMEALLVSLSVLAPHAACELLENLCNKQLRDCQWPRVDEALAQEHEVTIVIQINGKTRSNLVVERGAQQSEVQKMAQEAANKWLEGVTIIKVIFVQDRLINFVVK